MDFNYDEFWKAVKDWPSITSLIVLLILETALMKFIGLSSESWFLLGLAIIYLITIIFWLIYRKTPKKRKNSFGFVVSIYCDDSSIEKKFREDFIKTLKTELKDRTSGNHFDFIELKNHISEEVTDKTDALKVLNKCNGDFLIYGRVRTREEGGERSHVLDINCAAQHTPIPDVVSNRFSQEMDELLPRKIRIEDSKFLESFEITSKWIEISSKYLIGHIKFLAEDFDSALDLYSEVLSKLPLEKSSGIADTLRSRCYESITVVYETKIFLAHKNWVKTHADEYLYRMREIFDEYDRYNLNSSNIERVRAIFLVFQNKDFAAGRAILEKIPNKSRDALWHLNSAFLHAGQGNLKSAIREYRNAKARPSEAFGNNLIGDVEDFIGFFLERNPDFSHLHYCLGFINKELKQDSILAKNHFSAFLKFTPETGFLNEQRLAKKWLTEL